MSAKPEVKQFLKESKSLLGDVAEGNIQEFLEAFRTFTVKIVDQLETVKLQQNMIIDLLKEKVDLDAYEREILDLLKAKLERGE